MPHTAPGRAIVALLVLLFAHAWAQPEQPADVRVLRLQIVEADTGALVGFAREGEVLDVSNFGEGALTLVALTEPENLGTVRFYLDGARFHQSADPPYAVTPLGEDGELSAWDPPAGDHTLTVVPITTELGPDASLSEAMDRGEVGPWYEIELAGAEAPEAEPEAESSGDPADAEAQQNAEEQENQDEPDVPEDSPDAEDTGGPEGSGDPEDAGDAGLPDDSGDSDDSQELDDPEDSGDVGIPAESPEDRTGGTNAEAAADASEELREETAPVRTDAPEAVAPEATDDAVRAPTVPPQPSEGEETFPEPARLAAPAEDDEAAAVAPAPRASVPSGMEDTDAAPVEETLRLRWPLERMDDGTPVGGGVLLSRYPSDVVILAVDLAGFEDPSGYRLSLKRNGCERGGEHLVELSPFDARLGASLTEIAASFSALRYGNFGVVVTPGDDEQPLACAVLALDEQVQ